MGDPLYSWIILIWVGVAVPMIVYGSIGRGTPERRRVTEERYTRYGLWWSAGLIVYLIGWKTGAPALWLAVVLALYLLVSLAIWASIKLR